MVHGGCHFVSCLKREGSSQYGEYLYNEMEDIARDPKEMETNAHSHQLREANSSKRQGRISSQSLREWDCLALKP